MAIGRNSRNGSVRSSIRAPKFLDKSSGFYGRLDEPETAPEDVTAKGTEEEQKLDDDQHLKHNPCADEEVCDFTDGMMEDDGETLLRRKSSRRSSRWRRSSWRKQREGKGDEEQSKDASLVVEDNKLKMKEESEKAGMEKEPALVHFPVREDADDQVLIRDKKRGREEENEEGNVKRDQEGGMKMVKKNSVKNYRKAFDRALRRGWESFVSNLYSVTLTPVTSSSPPSSSPSLKKKQQLHSLALAEFQ